MQQDQRIAVQPHSRFMAVHPQSRALAQRRSRAILQQSEKMRLFSKVAFIFVPNRELLV